MGKDGAPMLSEEGRRHGAYDTLFSVFQSLAIQKPDNQYRERRSSTEPERRSVTLPDKTVLTLTHTKEVTNGLATKPEHIHTHIKALQSDLPTGWEETYFSTTKRGLLYLLIPALPRQIKTDGLVVHLPAEKFDYSRTSVRTTPEMARGLDNFTPQLAEWVSTIHNEKHYRERPLIFT